MCTGAGNPNFGNKWSDEQKQHLSQKVKESGRYNGTGNPNSKPVMCVETGEVFSLIKDAMERYRIKTHGGISVALSERSRTAGGVHWVMQKDFESLQTPEQRFMYLLAHVQHTQCLIVSYETKEYFSSMLRFAAHVRMPEHKIRQHFRKHNVFFHMNKAYTMVNGPGRHTQ